LRAGGHVADVRTTTTTINKKVSQGVSAEPALTWRRGCVEKGLWRMA